MGDSTNLTFPNPVSQTLALSVVRAALEELETSAEPAIVFASLVRLSVPRICEAATATISGPDEKVYAVSWPRDALKHHESRRTSVITRFHVPASENHTACRGDVALRFGSSDSCQPFVAQLLVDRATATIERARLAETATRSQGVAAHLERALASNREISVAVGILMARHKLTTDQAFGLLSEVSQRSNRKLRAIALEVTRSGVLEVPTAVTLLRGGDLDA
jgi:hypothetical protein